MVKRKITINYFYPIRKKEDNREVISDLTELLKGLVKIDLDKRLIKDGEDSNIQLKKINYNEDSERWELGFLKNRIEAPFISKLEDENDTAESLEDNEFVGQECCLIYDPKSKIIALQNNRSSASFKGVNEFLNNFSEKSFELSTIVYKDKYCDISDDSEIKYKSIILGYTEISKLQELASMDDDKSIMLLAKLAGDLSAINGKLELNVGRAKQFLVKKKLKSMVEFFKNNKEITKSLKVKMLDHDHIRIIDLLNNKVVDETIITIGKDDPKTFDKILKEMEIKFNDALKETFDKCKAFVEV